MAKSLKTRINIEDTQCQGAIGGGNQLFQYEGQLRIPVDTDGDTVPGTFRFLVACG